MRCVECSCEVVDQAAWEVASEARRASWRAAGARKSHARGKCTNCYMRAYNRGEVTRRVKRNQMQADRAEDLAWMAATGECLTGAARRLGVNRKTLETWAKKHVPDLLERLLAHEPADWNYRSGGANQWVGAR